MRFEYRESSKKYLVFFLEFDSAWIGVSRGYFIQLERVCISWRLFFSISTLSLRQDSLLEEEKGKEGRQTIIFTPLNPFGDNPDEEAPGVDLSVPGDAQPHHLET